MPLTPVRHPGEPDDALTASLRPQGLADFIGQAQVKANLEIFIAASRQRQDALDHVLLYGPPGLGKTTFAHIIANERGVEFRATAAPILSRTGDLAAILTHIVPESVLFIDEIHRLPIAVEEMLYAAMEDRKLDVLLGEGPGARTLRIDLPPFTLVGATTRLGLLSAPLRDRFGIQLPLHFYTVAELEQVVHRGARLLGVPVADSGCHEIARRARGTPRIALRLLRRVHDFALVAQAPSITDTIADHALVCLAIDRLGLDNTDHRYLGFIDTFYDGGPVGIQTIAAGLSEHRDNLEDMIEPYLLQIGFLQRTPRGRMLTPQARDWVAAHRTTASFSKE
jgi:Holliday junction DNA helicase RuvB